MLRSAQSLFKDINKIHKVCHYIHDTQTQPIINPQNITKVYDEVLGSTKETLPGIVNLSDFTAKSRIQTHANTVIFVSTGHCHCHINSAVLKVHRTVIRHSRNFLKMKELEH